MPSPGHCRENVKSGIILYSTKAGRNRIKPGNRRGGDWGGEGAGSYVHTRSTGVDHGRSNFKVIFVLETEVLLFADIVHLSKFP